tara:strand:+ start:1462 stop:2403 length:942 start_codon:yes stop_codon:yes gene_type:complete
MGALLFPGQGSQIVGMGSQFYKNFQLVKKIFDISDQKLNYSLSKIILEGSEEDLKLTKNTQPAILTVSYSIFKVLKDEFNFNLNKLKYFSGHSLGEYSALVCAGSLNFEDAIYLLHERGKAMQNAVPIGKGSMLAVLGTKISDINNLLNERENKKEICEIANDNSEGQVIISGEKKGVDAFQKVLKKNNIKFIPLKVSAPFHCSLMKSAADIMREKIEKINFGVPKCEIVSNVNALPQKNPVKIKELLYQQIFSTVKWRESLINMSENGIKNFIEIGPGKVLSGMVKRTVKNSKCFSINSITDIKSLIDEFEK